jgi:hypothetical protein
MQLRRRVRLSRVSFHFEDKPLPRKLGFESEVWICGEAQSLDLASTSSQKHYQKSRKPDLPIAKCKDSSKRTIDA